MRTRKEIKAIGRDSFRACYWPCVGASVLVMLAIYAASMVYVGGILLTGPLTIGLYFLYIQLILGKPDLQVSLPFETAFRNYGRRLGGYWWMQLWLFLWSLIPLGGIVMVIIKSLSYSLTMYILADCPNVMAQDALKLSMRIMQGKKGKLFVFYLSFIGWGLLSLLTCGLLSVFYVGPYMQSSMACWYLEAREDALRNGVVTLAQLEGTEAV